MVSMKYEKGDVQNPINNLSILAFEHHIAPQCCLVSRYQALFPKAVDTKKNGPKRMQLTGKKIWVFCAFGPVFLPPLSSLRIKIVRR